MRLSRTAGNSTGQQRKYPLFESTGRNHDLTALFGPRTHSEEYFAGLAKDPSLKVKLTGSWETLIGPVDNFGK
jgi:hypothetical protein